MQQCIVEKGSIWRNVSVNTKVAMIRNESLQYCRYLENSLGGANTNPQKMVEFTATPQLFVLAKVGDSIKENYRHALDDFLVQFHQQSAGAMV